MITVWFITNCMYYCRVCLYISILLMCMWLCIAHTCFVLLLCVIVNVCLLFVCVLFVVFFYIV